MMAAGPLRLISAWILLGLCLVALAAHGLGEPTRLVKRQVQSNRPADGRPKVSVSLGGSENMATSMATSTSSGSMSDKNRVVGPANMKPASVGVSSDDSDQDQDSDEIVERRPRPARRPRPNVNRKPPRRERYEDVEEYHYDDDDCDDDYDGYGGNLFHSMATRPMRHMNRLMGGIMDQIEGMSSDMMFNNHDGGGGNVVSASSSSFSSNQDDRTGGRGGFSRTSTLVNNNGRTQGIISETRNGRTKTQRIGDE